MTNEPEKLAETSEWWEGLQNWHRNQLRHDAKLPLNFKIHVPFGKIKTREQLAILALRPIFDAKKAEQDARFEASERKREKLIAHLRAGYVRDDGENDEDYFERCIEYHYTLPRGDETESWSILRELLPPLCDCSEVIAIPLPKSNKLRGVRLILFRTPCGWTTGSEWSLDGWMGSFSGASIWPETVEPARRWYHPTRDGALAAIVNRLSASFARVAASVHESVGTDAQRKSCADAIPILKEWLATMTSPVLTPPPKPKKPSQLELFL